MGGLVYVFCLEEEQQLSLSPAVLCEEFKRKKRAKLKHALQIEIIKGIVLCSNEMKQFCWPLGNANMEAAKHEKKPIVGLETRD